MQLEVFIASCGTLLLLKGLQTIPEFSGKEPKGAGSYRQNPGNEPCPHASWASSVGLSLQPSRPMFTRAVLISNTALRINPFSWFAGFGLGNIIMSGVQQILNSHFNEFVKWQCIETAYQVPLYVGAVLTLCPSWSINSSSCLARHIRSRLNPMQQFHLSLDLSTLFFFLRECAHVHTCG